jgi:Kef-type K+ transport system membrane component KefB
MVLLVAVESIVTALIVFLGVYAVTRDLPLSVFFGALAPATAPAGTVAVIQENNAKGPLSRTLYTVVGFDDGIAIIIFGFAAAFAKSLLIAETPGGEGFVMESVLSPVIEISLSVIVGAVLGVLLSLSIRSVRNDTDYFLLVAGFVLVASGLAKWWPISIILTNMIIGFVVANTNLKTRMTSVIRQLQPSTPFFFILFFFLAGAHLDLRLITNLGFIGIAYILCRTLGKFIGARLGAEAGGMSDIVKKYLGIGILSQAGVAIGLSLVVRHELTMIGTPHAELIGSMVITSITATSIVFEIIGPILTRIALDKAGEINSEN